MDVLSIREENGFQIVEAKNGPIWSLAGVGGIVGVLATLVGVWIVDVPGYEWNRDVATKAFQMEILDHALRDTNAVGRRAGLELLFSFGILTCGEDADPTGCAAMKARLSDEDWIPPNWSGIEERFNSTVLVDGLYEGSYSPDLSNLPTGGGEEDK